MKVLGISGSARKDGNTAIIIQRVFTELEKEGIETELIQLAGKKIRGCTACLKCRENKDNRCSVNNDSFNKFYEKLLAADGIILGSPTYFADMTPEMKAFIDRAGYVSRANDNSLKRKVGAAVSVARRAGAMHTLDSINHFFLITQMIIPGSIYWNVVYGREKGEVEADIEGMQTMQVLGENMAWLLKKVNA
jgi:multimeric flavodoxin WrbA